MLAALWRKVPSGPHLHFGCNSLRIGPRITAHWKAQGWHMEAEEGGLWSGPPKLHAYFPGSNTQKVMEQED